MPLYGPRYLSIQTLPPLVKDLARERLLAARSKVEKLDGPNVQWLAGTFDATLAYMDEGELNRRDLMEFLFFSENSDKVFGDSWRRVCPDLARLLFPQSAR